MKKNIYYLLALTIFCGACKKSSQKDVSPVGKLYHIAYNVTGFTQSTGNFGTNAAGSKTVNSLATTSLATTINVLFCTIYDATGKAIVVTKQIASQTDFGKISSDLPAGTYTVVFAGGKQGLHVDASQLANDALTYITNTPIPVPTPSTPATYVNRKFYDTFFKKMIVTVSGASTGSEDVTLDRIIGQAQIKIKDKVPSAVKYFAVFVHDDFSFSIDKALPQRGTDDDYPVFVVVPSTGIDTTGYTITFPILNTTTPFSLQLYATSGETNTNGLYYSIQASPTYSSTYANRIISGITAKANETTLITGNVFGGDGTGGFQVTIDPAWNPTSITQAF